MTEKNKKANHSEFGRGIVDEYEDDKLALDNADANNSKRLKRQLQQR